MTAPAKRITAPTVVTLEVTLRWTMIVVSLTFLILYAAALAGWLRPMGENSIVARLEPIIFLLIGFYFGLVSISSISRSRKKELDRTRERLDELQLTKEQIQRERDAFAERISNAKVALDRFMLVIGSDLAGDPILSKRLTEIVRKILNS